MNFDGTVRQYLLRSNRERQSVCMCGGIVFTWFWGFLWVAFLCRKHCISGRILNVVVERRVLCFLSYSSLVYKCSDRS